MIIRRLDWCLLGESDTADDDGPRYLLQTVTLSWPRKFYVIKCLGGIFFSVTDRGLYPARATQRSFHSAFWVSFFFSGGVRPAVMKFYNYWTLQGLSFSCSCRFPQSCITVTALHWMLPNGFPRQPHTMQFNSGYTTLDVTPMFRD